MLVRDLSIWENYGLDAKLAGSAQTGAQPCNTVNQCFKEGTLVETEEGLKPIEEIEVGDKVLAYDEQTGEQTYKKVVRLFRGETEEWYHIHTNGEVIVCTSGHPFYVQGKGFVPAKELTQQDKLTLSDGTQVCIKNIEIEKLATPETTYNFEVEDFHTYYVTDSKVLVHNTCNKEAEKIANDLGYKKVRGQQSHGQAIFKNSKASSEVRYITPDIDSHSGGYWKGASSIKGLGSKGTRSGTYDIYLRRIGP